MRPNRVAIPLPRFGRSMKPRRAQSQLMIIKARGSRRPASAPRDHGSAVGGAGDRRGLRNIVATVLITNRIHNIVAAVAFARRAIGEAHAYVGFRHAFGRRLCEHPDNADRAL